MASLGSSATLPSDGSSRAPLSGGGKAAAPPHYAAADTRSLQRPRPGPGQGAYRPPPGAVPVERSTYSLPRTAHHHHQQPAPPHHDGYYTQDRSRGNRHHLRGMPSELQPDFYFMPSQRKYSGEVVRVYVDYNK